MKSSLAVTIAATLASLFLSGPILSGPSLAQPAKPPTPTTRILAIGTVNPGVDPAAVRSILPTEVRETVKLYTGWQDRSMVLTSRTKRRRVHP